MERSHDSRDYRGSGDYRSSGKRPLSEISQADRDYELSIRQKLEHSDLRRRREQERPRSPEWRRGEARRHDEGRRFEASQSVNRAADSGEQRRFRNFKTTVSKRR
jgi:hypothetical protein